MALDLPSICECRMSEGHCLSGSVMVLSLTSPEGNVRGGVGTWRTALILLWSRKRVSYLTGSEVLGCSVCRQVLRGRVTLYFAFLGLGLSETLPAYFKRVGLWTS